MLRLAYCSSWRKYNHVAIPGTQMSLLLTMIGKLAENSRPINSGLIANLTVLEARDCRSRHIERSAISQVRLKGVTPVIAWKIKFCLPIMYVSPIVGRSFLVYPSSQHVLLGSSCFRSPTDISLRLQYIPFLCIFASNSSQILQQAYPSRRCCLIPVSHRSFAARHLQANQ